MFYKSVYYSVFEYIQNYILFYVTLLKYIRVCKYV